jgi:hypothetical protein
MIIIDADSQIEHYELNPPTALAGLRVEAVDVEFDFTLHPDTVNTIFELACRCGNTLFETFAILDEGQVVPPITTRCSSCGNGQVIFDPNVHGYGAIVDGDRYTHGFGAHEVEMGSDTVDPPHHVMIRFEYPADVLVDGDHDGMEHELFSFVTILAVDPDDGEIGFLFDGEA